MSHVADVVLVANTYLGQDWKTERLERINEWLLREARQKLVSVDEPGHWYGGSKVLQCEMAIGAINYLNIEAFLEFLRTEIPWGDDDGTTQALIKDEQQPCFTLHDVYVAS